MTLFAYTAATPRVYPEFGITAEVGDVVDFGLVSIPNDGRWGATDDGAAATKKIGPNSPSYVLPGAPTHGEALTWDDDLGAYVPTDLGATYAPIGSAGFTYDTDGMPMVNV